MADIVALRKPGAAKQRATLRVLPDIRDRAFLPAALEIVETPPSPVRTALLLAICGLATAGIAWACLGKVDIYATARGKIEPAGHVKVVQPLQPGVVASVSVADGQRVAAGDVLLQLDAREAASELEGATFARTAAEAEAMRRRVEIDAVRAGALVTPPFPAWPSHIPEATGLREQAVLEQNLGQMTETLANLDDRVREKEAAVDQLDRSIVAETALLRPLAERVALRQALYAEGNNSRLNLLDAQQSFLETQAQLAGDRGRRDAAAASIATLQSERRRTVAAFLADDLQRLADARKVADEKSQDQARARARLEQMTLRAPIAGTVQALSVTNPGQVVTTGQELLRIVPADAPLQIQAYVNNDDIGFVHAGLAAVIKVDSFPFTRFGTVDADVVQVAYDALPPDAVNHAVTDAAKPRSESSGSPSAMPMTDLVFEAFLRPKASRMSAAGIDVPLSPGMTVTAEIKIGRRSVISYLLAAVLQDTQEAMHEQ